MKIFFTAIILSCFVIAAHAQSSSGLYKNQIKNFGQSGITADTSLNNLNSQKALGPGSYLNLQPLNQTTGLNMAAMGTLTVYSRMPVAHLQATGNMPVARLNANGFMMPVKKVVVMDPLKPALALQ